MEPTSDAEERSIQQRAHGARLAYEKERELYAAFAQSVESVLRRCFDDARIVVHEITCREKDPQSFERKAAQRSRSYPAEPKYSDPLTQITDKAAVRVITYFLSTVTRVCAIIDDEFSVVERLDKMDSDRDRVGYRSVHYLVRYSANRCALPEYRKYKGLVAEVQVRTILQHAWAEIEHDIQYKAVATLPSQVSRRFSALAGLIEIADREFQAIDDEDRSIRDEALAKVNLGELKRVEIRRDSIRAYLNEQYGKDGPDTNMPYDWMARVLHQNLGFRDIEEVHQCVKDRNDGNLSRIIYGAQSKDHLARFELVLLAAMGKNYILAHPWADGQMAERFVSAEIEKLDELRRAGIKIKDYRPGGYPEVTLRVSDLYARLAGR